MNKQELKDFIFAENEKIKKLEAEISELEKLREEKLDKINSTREEIMSKINSEFKNQNLFLPNTRSEFRKFSINAAGDILLSHTFTHYWVGDDIVSLDKDIIETEPKNIEDLKKKHNNKFLYENDIKVHDEVVILSNKPRYCFVGGPNIVINGNIALIEKDNIRVWLEGYGVETISLDSIIDLKKFDTKTKRREYIKENKLAFVEDVIKKHENEVFEYKGQFIKIKDGLKDENQKKIIYKSGTTIYIGGGKYFIYDGEICTYKKKLI